MYEPFIGQASDRYFSILNRYLIDTFLCCIFSIIFFSQFQYVQEKFDYNFNNFYLYLYFYSIFFFTFFILDIFCKRSNSFHLFDFFYFWRLYFLFPFLMFSKFFDICIYICNLKFSIISTFRNISNIIELL